MDETEFVGPKYLGCVRMIQLQFMQLMLLLETIFLLNTIKDIMIITDETDTLIFNIAYLVPFNLFPLFSLLRIMTIYKLFDKCTEFYDMSRNSTMICLSNFLIVVTIIRIGCYLAAAFCFLLEIMPLCLYSSL